MSVAGCVLQQEAFRYLGSDLGFRRMSVSLNGCAVSVFSNLHINAMQLRNKSRAPLVFDPL